VLSGAHGASERNIIDALYGERVDERQASQIRQERQRQQDGRRYVIEYIPARRHAMVVGSIRMAVERYATSVKAGGHATRRLQPTAIASHEERQSVT